MLVLFIYFQNYDENIPFTVGIRFAILFSNECCFCIVCWFCLVEVCLLPEFEKVQGQKRLVDCVREFFILKSSGKSGSKPPVRWLRDKNFLFSSVLIGTNPHILQTIQFSIQCNSIFGLFVSYTKCTQKYRKWQNNLVLTRAGDFFWPQERVPFKTNTITFHLPFKLWKSNRNKCAYIFESCLA